MKVLSGEDMERRLLASCGKVLKDGIALAVAFGMVATCISMFLSVYSGLAYGKLEKPGLRETHVKAP